MDDFITLAALLRGAAAVPATATSPDQRTPREAQSSSAPLPPERGVVRNVIDYPHAEIVHELTLLRLAAIESLTSAKATLLEAFAADVLGRELALAPADIEALARSAIARFAELEPVTLIVSAADAERVRAPLPTRVDAALAAGDLVVEVRDGNLESSFAFRLQSALDRAAAASDA